MKGPKKTKFQEFLELDMRKDESDDVEVERKLAKRLKVKGGKLAGLDDGMNDLFEGIPSVFESLGADVDGGAGDHEKRKRKKKKKSFERAEKACDGVAGSSLEVSVAKRAASAKEDAQVVVLASSGGGDEIQKYTAPHLRFCTSDTSEELCHIRRRVRGLLNRLSESNVESVTHEIAGIFRSISRSDGCQIIAEEVVSSCSNGPRGNEQYAAVFAAFVAGMACSVGFDISAKLIASLAVAYENEYAKEDGLSLRNITMLLSYMCIFGVCSSDLIYDFLSVLVKRLTELDVSMVLLVLQCCGGKLRSDDPTLMKDFILNIQSRVSELKSFCESTRGSQPEIHNKRMEFMLETIVDIKNNKQRPKEEPAYHARIKKWLQKLKADDILLRGLKWSKLLDPHKKGQWWLSVEITHVEDNIEEVATTIDKEVVEAQKLVQLAAAQKMNTDVRRAIFCIIMSGEDYLDAFEKILRLDMSGKQDREIMRVLVECCLQEKMFNKYYAVLASKLCSHEKTHKITLQYCIWDHFKELESMELFRSMNFAKFVSEMLSSFTLSLSLLKTAELANPKQLTPRRIMHFRMLFEFIFENNDAIIWNIFSRIATPESEVLCESIVFFVKKFVVTGGSAKTMAEKFKIAKKALNNVAGVLM